MKADSLQILYLQIREDEITRHEELNEFVRYSGLKAEQFTILNVFDTPHFDLDWLKGQHSVFVGGSSDASVLKGDMFVEEAKSLLLHCLEVNIPVFASCFGFQVAVEALGGNVILDPENMEMGSYSMYLTNEAQKDLLFYDTPSPFCAISGHKERAVSLPNNVTLLAYSELCPYHSFKVNEKPFYAFQFHPEVNDIDLINRITRYQARYLNEREALEKIKQITFPTPESKIIVKKFVERILLPRFCN